MLGHEQLYKEFHLNEPWDSPHNKPLLAKMPKIYAAARRQDDRRHAHQNLRRPRSVFEANGAAPSMVDVTDGTSATLMAVQAGDPVPWTKPEEISVYPRSPCPSSPAR